MAARFRSGGVPHVSSGVRQIVGGVRRTTGGPRLKVRRGPPELFVVGVRSETKILIACDGSGAAGEADGG